jgi:hypothetical protein
LNTSKYHHLINVYHYHRGKIQNIPTVSLNINTNQSSGKTHNSQFMAMTEVDGNLDPGLRQAQKSGGVKMDLLHT